MFQNVCVSKAARSCIALGHKCMTVRAQHLDHAVYMHAVHVLRVFRSAQEWPDLDVSNVTAHLIGLLRSKLQLVPSEVSIEADAVSRRCGLGVHSPDVGGAVVIEPEGSVAWNSLNDTL